MVLCWDSNFNWLCDRLWLDHDVRLLAHIRSVKSDSSVATLMFASDLDILGT